MFQHKCYKTKMEAISVNLTNTWIPSISNIFRICNNRASKAKITKWCRDTRASMVNLKTQTSLLVDLTGKINNLILRFLPQLLKITKGFQIYKIMACNKELTWDPPTKTNQTLHMSRKHHLWTIKWWTKTIFNQSHRFSHKLSLKDSL